VCLQVNLGKIIRNYHVLHSRQHHNGLEYTLSTALLLEIRQEKVEQLRTQFPFLLSRQRHLGHTYPPLLLAHTDLI
jgi:hypothetical protein